MSTLWIIFAVVAFAVVVALITASAFVAREIDEMEKRDELNHHAGGSNALGDELKPYLCFSKQHGHFSLGERSHLGNKVTLYARV